MTPDQEAEFMRIVTETHTRMKMLISEDGAHGIVPEVKASVQEVNSRVDTHDKQINYWKGAIALAGLLILALGAVLVTHILGGR